MKTARNMIRLRLVLWLIFASTTLWILAVLIEPASPNELPIEPPIEDRLSWNPHRSLGVVINYSDGVQDISFAHSLMSDGPAPECKEMSQVGGRVFLMVFGSVPWRYEISAIPTAYQIGSQSEWQGMIEKTYMGGE